MKKTGINKASRSKINRLADDTQKEISYNKKSADKFPSLKSGGLKEKKLNNILPKEGEMSELIQNFQWDQTPLGPIEEWSQSLRTTVSIMLTNRFPMLLWWGKDYISLYNDAYIPVLGGKHPWALGKPVKECWSEIWSTLQPLIDTPFHGGQATWIESFPLELNRYGFLEETHFTVAYSAVPDETTRSNIGGVLATVHEITEKIINERVLSTLRELGTITFEEKSLDVIYRNVAESMGKNNKDFPFAVVYKISEDRNSAESSASTGISKEQYVFPEIIDLKNPNNITQDLCEAYEQNEVIVSEIKGRDKTLPTGGWDRSPTRFIHLPVSAAGAEHPYCIISAALNPYRKFDEPFQQFCQLIAERVSLEINKMLALEEETKRAKALAQIDKAKTIFFSNISHEFRTPLTLLLNPLEELLKNGNGNFSEPERQNLETSHRNALRLLKLVNTLLDFSRIESGRQQAFFELTDIASLTKNLASNFRSMIENGGLEFIIKTEGSLPPVYLDRNMWEKIVFNLISNAFKYTLNGKIIVELSEEPGFVLFKVTDTGVGIPDDELPKIFERFHRVQNVVGRSYEGTGIGLSLVKELVRFHHGDIKAESKFNAGSTFIVKIPVGIEHLDPEHILKNGKSNDEFALTRFIDDGEILFSKKGATDNGSSPENKNLPLVLIVDDNADMREHLRSLLVNQFNLMTAENGKEALEKISLQKPSLVLSDIMMPVMDGITLLKKLKSNDDTSQIPVVLLTARAGEESKIEGLETGADDYLVKPFSGKELLSRIQTQIFTQKLRTEAQRKLQTLFNQAPAAIAVLEGPSYIYTLANPAYQKLVNRNKEELLGKSIKDVFPEIEDQDAISLIDEVYTSGKTKSMPEFPFKMNILNDGIMRQRYFNFSIDAVKNEEDIINTVVIVIYDITDQVEARKKIEENEKQFNILANNIQNLAWIADGEGRRFWFNQRWFDYTGTTLEEVQGSGWEKVHHADHIKKILAFLETAWKKNEPWELTHPLRRHDGVYEWFLTRAFPLTDSSGKIYRWIGTNTNIEKQKTESLEFENAVKQRTEELRNANRSLKEQNMLLEVLNKELQAADEALKKQEVIRESEKNLRNILEGLPQLAWRSSPDGSQIYFNKQWYDYTGLTEEESQGDGWASALHPEDRERVLPEWKKTLDEKKNISVEYRLRNKNGVYHWFLTRAEPFFDTDNNMHYFIGTCTDIDDTKRVQQDLILGKQRREDFLKIASHELKTPITTIKGYVQLVLDSIKDGKELSADLVNSSLQTIDNHVARLTRLITELLDVSRIEAGQLELNKETFMMNGLVDEMVHDILYTHPTMTIKVKSDFECCVHADRDRIGQVISNLLTNAIKYSPDSNQIDVRVHKQGNNSVAVSIKDYGIGIDSSNHEKIFDQFYRVEGKSQQTYPGFGVGLYIIKNIIQRHDGSIQLKSEIGKGSTFTFSLPCNC